MKIYIFGTKRASSHFDTEMMYLTSFVVFLAACSASTSIASSMLNNSQGPPRRARSPPEIPWGYQRFPETGLRNYYRLHETPVTWFEAKAICERESAHLAIINSETERKLLVDFFNKDRSNKGQFWLGFHDLYKEGDYVTIFGEPLVATGYTVWVRGNPDNFQEEDCGAMYGLGDLNDLHCHFRETFVCEYPVY